MCEYFVAALPVSEGGETARTESLFLKKKKKTTAVMLLGWSCGGFPLHRGYVAKVTFDI